MTAATTVVGDWKRRKSKYLLFSVMQKSISRDNTVTSKYTSELTMSLQVTRFCDRND